jgi:hypothetical protein
MEARTNSWFETAPKKAPPHHEGPLWGGEG